jgi:hypothetical protein
MKRFNEFIKEGLVDKMEPKSEKDFSGINKEIFNAFKDISALDIKISEIFTDKGKYSFYIHSPIDDNILINVHYNDKEEIEKNLKPGTISALAPGWNFQVYDSREDHGHYIKYNGKNYYKTLYIGPRNDEQNNWNFILKNLIEQIYGKDIDASENKIKEEAERLSQKLKEKEKILSHFDKIRKIINR